MKPRMRLPVQFRRYTYRWIFRIKDGQLIYQNSGKLYSASILSELSVQGDIESDSVIEGDMCIVTGQVPSVEAATDTGYDGWIASEYGNWDISGADTDVTSVENSDGSGSYARLAGNGDGDHVLSQNLPEPRQIIFQQILLPTGSVCHELQFWWQPYGGFRAIHSVLKALP